MADRSTFEKAVKAVFNRKGELSRIVMFGSDKLTYEQVPRDALAGIHGDVIAVLEAIRDPDEAMVECGRAATVAFLDITGSALTVAREKMRRRYAAMIDELLKEASGG